MQKLISAVVRDRSGVVFDDQIRGVTAYNDRGMFDVLPVHSNFISVLRKKLVLHKTDGSKQEIHLDSGVIRVLTGKIEAFIGLK